jgi:hypothetical protein
MRGAVQRVDDGRAVAAPRPQLRQRPAQPVRAVEQLVAALARIRGAFLPSCERILQSGIVARPWVPCGFLSPVHQVEEDDATGVLLLDGDRQLVGKAADGLA